MIDVSNYAATRDVHWVVYVFDEINKAFNEYTNLDTAFADIPKFGIVAVVQLYLNSDGSHNYYVIDWPERYIFTEGLNLWSGSDSENITFRESQGITVLANLKGYGIPDPWFAALINHIRADSRFPNALDRASFGREQQEQFDAAVVHQARRGNERIKSLEASLVNAGVPLPFEESN